MLSATPIYVVCVKGDRLSGPSSFRVTKRTVVVFKYNHHFYNCKLITLSLNNGFSRLVIILTWMILNQNRLTHRDREEYLDPADQTHMVTRPTLAGTVVIKVSLLRSEGGGSRQLASIQMAAQCSKLRKRISVNIIWWKLESCINFKFSS